MTRVEVWSESWGVDCHPEDSDVVSSSFENADSAVPDAVEEWYQERFENDAPPCDDYVYAYARVVGTTQVYKVRMSWSLKFSFEDVESVQEKT